MLVQLQGEELERVARLPQPGNWKTASNVIDTVRLELDNWLYQVTEGLVQSGPFEGMKLMRETSWKDTRLAPLLLGSYEEELQGELERQIKRLEKLASPKITVVGCAEGYYAIGLKRRLPNANVFIVDPDEKAIEISLRAAFANKVQLIINAPPEIYLENTDFLLIDAEGAEIFYLDPTKYPSLLQANVIVELHNFPATKDAPAQNTDSILLDRFRGSHRINMILEGPRNPNKYKFLCAMTNDYRWIAVSEGRTCLMGWYAMEPKGLCYS